MAVLFDTNRFIKRLARHSMDVPLAVAVASIVKDGVGPSVQALADGMVTRSEAEREMGRHRAEMEQKFAEAFQKQKEVFSAVQNLQECTLRDLRTTRQRVRDLLATVRSERRLDCSLEQSRQRHALVEMNLKWSELQNKVDAALGQARTALGKLRHDVLYTLTGFFFTSIAAFFGYLRLCS